MSLTPHHHPKPPGWRPHASKPRLGTYCGAWARTRGRGCRQAPMKGYERCRMHGPGGGPKTAESKAVISAAVKVSWARWREERGLPETWRYGATWLSRRKRETAADFIAKHGPHKDRDD